ncbi:hypothetical protein HPP92_020068 [Vanilla planifolia]|uniref:Serine-threonine/tyrosine-protein kinase catalytic domain-containing protein n=1 Tax=Vanilla planifolia TaxID=51239 RepID=A0A835Q1P9_VANPL|nr:hypothetical protein HPP92_020068 [Vanilla planifolia]
MQEQNCSPGHQTPKHSLGRKIQCQDRRLRLVETHRSAAEPSDDQNERDAGVFGSGWLTSIITEKVDVYSFGVVLLEIMCGRRNLDYSQPEEAVHLVALLEKMNADQLPATLLPKRSDSDMQHGEASKLMGLAMWCLQSESKKRPSMSKVVKVLEGFADVESNIDHNFTNCYSTMLQETNRKSSSVASLT